MAAVVLIRAAVVIVGLRFVRSDQVDKECLFHSDCPSDQYCLDNRCAARVGLEDPCSRCGNNTLCDPSCTCKPGFSRGYDIEPRSLDTEEEFTDCVPSFCTGDAGCPEGFACTDYKCGDPCALCGLNTLCTVIGHDPFCSCKPGFVTNKDQELEPGDDGYFSDCIPDLSNFCSSDSSCPKDQQCSNSKCVDPCPEACGEDAACRVDDHVVKCECKPGFAGDPKKKCNPTRSQLVRCTTNSDCPLNQLCDDQTCRPSCQMIQCGSNTACIIRDHLPKCECMPGFTGDPNRGCVFDLLQLGRCTSNSDCPLNQLCVEQTCRLSCQMIQCGSNTSCIIRDHLPKCECMPGFTGDPYLGCKMPDEEECSRDVDCPLDESCVNQECVDPCQEVACTSNADCKSVDHKASCVCRPGFIETADTGCALKDEVECTSNVDCPPDKSCISRHCVDTCQYVSCTSNAECQSVDHKAFCICRPGFIEVADRGCVKMDKVECSKDVDCPPDKSCVNRHCVDPCLEVSCLPNADCKSADHKASCVCRPGFVETADTGCVSMDKVECTSNVDCPIDKSCVRNHCVDQCIGITCMPNADCKTLYHKASCVCRPGFTETANKSCVPMDVPGCTRDADCQSYEVCLSRECYNPCMRVQCGNNSRCVVTNHKAMCRCKEGYLGDPYVGCQMHKFWGCSSDRDCPHDKVCYPRGCEDPCRNTVCGENAVCRTTNHRASCICVVGDPSTGCREIHKIPPYIPKWPKKKRFHLFTDRVLTWNDALWYCQEKGGRLATVEHEEENYTILNLIRRSGIFFKHFWIAGTDQGHEGRWQWATTGKPITGYSYWQTYQPNNLFPGQHCLSYCYLSLFGIFTKFGYWWNDQYCNVHAMFICEFYY